MYDSTRNGLNPTARPLLLLYLKRLRVLYPFETSHQARASPGRPDETGVHPAKPQTAGFCLELQPKKRQCLLAPLLLSFSPSKRPTQAR